MTPSSATTQDRSRAMHGRHARHGTREMQEAPEQHATREKRARQRRARTPTMRRHWRELVELALAADDVYAAAALYPHADDADRAR
ncbi:MAG TPA: hypothetical protein VJS18_15000, partial [Paraburkholderia sp.]|nr:hypothetical protein [Paraburkholderia sp.]